MPDALLRPRPTSSLWGPEFAALRPPESLTCAGFHQSESCFRCTILQLLAVQVEGARPSRGALGNEVFVVHQCDAGASGKCIPGFA